MTAPNQPSSSPVETATVESGASTAGTDNASPDANVGQPDLHAPGMPPGGSSQVAPNRVMVRRAGPRVENTDAPPVAPVQAEGDVAPNVVRVSRAGSPAADHDTDAPVTSPSQPGGPAPADYPDAGEAPAKSASKADWVAYAVTSGSSKSDAEAATKDQLIDTYGPKD